MYSSPSPSGELSVKHGVDAGPLRAQVFYLIRLWTCNSSPSPSGELSIKHGVDAGPLTVQLFHQIRLWTCNSNPSPSGELSVKHGVDAGPLRAQLFIERYVVMWLNSVQSHNDCEHVTLTAHLLVSSVSSMVLMLVLSERSCSISFSVRERISLSLFTSCSAAVRFSSHNWSSLIKWSRFKNWKLKRRQN